ncbi:MAG: hypothetical protein KC466_15270 [Myxococcales bacterium]|nr:hypothetical protein [Myxococcales bacterium]
MARAGTWISILVGGAIAALGCDRTNGNVLGAGDVALFTDFDLGAQGWVSGFSDFSIDQALALQTVFDVRAMPAELNLNREGFLTGGNNISDDLFLYLKKRLTTADGIVANRRYRVTVDVTFASNAPTGCVGVGGAPGEDVFLKAGASGTEPLTTVGPGGFVSLSVDKGNQAAGGTAASVVDNIANGVPCDSVPVGQTAPYQLLTRMHTHNVTVQAGDTGDLWILVGTDSGFEGRTDLYYQSIQVILDEVG